jgi:hypothetical protein
MCCFTAVWTNLRWLVCRTAFQSRSWHSKVQYSAVQPLQTLAQRSTALVAGGRALHGAAGGCMAAVVWLELCCRQYGRGAVHRVWLWVMEPEVWGMEASCCSSSSHV